MLMVRSARTRRESDAGIYHVVSRGVGRQIIFEDDSDRQFYLELLKNVVTKNSGEILAWCLMGNHIHLLLRMKLSDLSEAMRIINSTYAMHFNKRHERIGHLMQGRFKSEAVDSDEYLLTVVRYIHQNPEKAKIAKTEEYPWSSYQEYIGEAKVTSTSFVLDVFGGVAAFKRFHDVHNDAATCIDEGRGRRVLDDESAIRAARMALGSIRIEEVASLPKPERDELLCRLKDARLSVRQIERLTGISKSVVAKARSGQ